MDREPDLAEVFALDPRAISRRTHIIIEGVDKEGLGGGGGGIGSHDFPLNTALHLGHVKICPKINPKASNANSFISLSLSCTGRWPCIRRVRGRLRE